VSRLHLSRAWRYYVHRPAQIAIDLALVGAAYYLAYLARFDGDIPVRYDKLFAATVGVVLGIKLLVFVAARFYTKWWRFTSVRDLQAIVGATALSSLIVISVLSLWQPGDLKPVPRGVFAFDFVLTLVLIGGVRFIVRSLIERPSRGAIVSRRGREVLICGAGDAGVTLLREMKRNTALRYQPIGLIDDDPRKRRLRVQGTRVLGSRDDLPRILREARVDEVIIAMPSATGKVRREIVEACRAAGVKCTTIPGLFELISGEVTVSQIREVQVEDLLGRPPMDIDFARVARYLTGKAVLITGAGGSIGSELCRQIALVGPRSLVLVDHAENNLFEIDRELRDRGHSRQEPVIADCRDETEMQRIFRRHRPEIVFHAAAYKHVPMMELNPLQAVSNNSLATAQLAQIAEDAGVERLCLISTDKAVEPKTVMGASKALAERVIESFSRDSNTRFTAVRFGNVLGSSGSVVPIFRRQIAAGGPVTVTHPDMTRYFMTIPEAVQLVIEATGIADGGDIFVLDMGEPVKILDLAENMIRLLGKEPGRDVAIEFSGIRPGEKLGEELFNVDEEVTPTRYGKIRRAVRSPLDPDALRAGMEEIARRVAEADVEGAERALWTTLRAGRVGAADGEARITDVHVREDHTV
jgi:FlaA1/EpsC-like NDP-sugar epimerase